MGMTWIGLTPDELCELMCSAEDQEENSENVLNIVESEGIING